MISTIEDIAHELKWKGDLAKKYALNVKIVEKYTMKRDCYENGG